MGRTPITAGSFSEKPRGSTALSEMQGSGMPGSGSGGRAWVVSDSGEAAADDVGSGAKAGDWEQMMEHSALSPAHPQHLPARRHSAVHHEAPRSSPRSDPTPSFSDDHVIMRVSAEVIIVQQNEPMEMNA